MKKTIRELMTAALVKAELPIPSDFVATMLLKDRFFVGYKFRYEGGFGILHADSTTVQLCDDEGNPIQSVVLEQESAA